MESTADSRQGEPPDTSTPENGQPTQTSGVANPEPPQSSTLAAPFAPKDVLPEKTPAPDGSALSDAEFRRFTQGMRFLSFFHGHKRPEDGLEFFLADFGRLPLLGRLDDDVPSLFSLFAPASPFSVPYSSRIESLKLTS